MVCKFVKAALRGMKDIMDDPDKAADDFVRFVPSWQGKEGAVKAPLQYYATLVYPGQQQLGEVNVERRAPAHAAGFLFLQGPDPAQVADRGALQQRVRQVR